MKKLNNYQEQQILKNHHQEMNHQQLLGLINRHNSKKQIRSKYKKIYNIDKILSVNTRNCRYVGGDREGIQTHLEIKFTSFNEPGTICLSLLLKNYNDIIHSI